MFCREITLLGRWLSQESYRSCHCDPPQAGEGILLSRDDDGIVLLPAVMEKRFLGRGIDMHKGRFVSLLALMLLLICSCEIEREPPGAVSIDFLPLNMGRFWVYEVEETQYFGENDFEESRFYYRDEITGQYNNEEGDQVYVVTRQKSMDQQQWQNEVAYTLRQSRNQLVRMLDNEQVIPLVFPVVASREWEANVFNSQNPEIFSMEQVGGHEMGDRFFPSAVLVRQSELDDFITIRDNRYEVFAEGIGMVESYYEVFSYCSRNDCLGEQIIQNGRFKHLKLLTHGVI